MPSKRKPAESEPFTLFGLLHDETKICPSCEAVEEHIRRETILPVAVGARAPMSRNRKFRFGYICFDCAAAETTTAAHGPGMSFIMARVATGNDRQEKLRLPNVRFGLPQVVPCKPGDMDRLHEWQDKMIPEAWGSDGPDPWDVLSP